MSPNLHPSDRAIFFILITKEQKKQVINLLFLKPIFQT